MNTELSFNLTQIGELTDAEINRMFMLMVDSYDGVTETIFRTDLMGKDWVGLIRDEHEEIQGFTTFAINPGRLKGATYNILFSGDTVIAPEFWGSQVMMQGWCRSVGRFIAGDSTKPWYWYLLSKGHRTYMYLPLFFSEYFPKSSPNETECVLKQIADEASQILYGACWKPLEGVIRFDTNHGALKPTLVEATYQKKGSGIARFFLEKNPGFYKGEELVCVAPIHPENMMRSAKDMVVEGMNQPISIRS